MIPERFPRKTIDEKATVPPSDFFLPDDLKAEKAEEAFRNRIADIGREDAIVITHNDADGLTSGAYMKHWYETVTGNTAIVYPTSYRGACNLPTALNILNTQATITPQHVFVTDLGASLFEDAEPEVKALYPDTEVTWIDHHQWTDNQLADLHSTAFGVVDDSACATELIVQLRNGTHDNTIPLPADGAPVTHEELATVVNDHDLWIKEDPRSDRIAIFAEYADDDDYMEAVLDGIDLLNTCSEELEQYEQEHSELLERAAERADFTTIGNLDVAFAYGYGPSSHIGNELVEEQGAELAVVIRPNGSASFYAHSNEEEFTDCHNVADQLDGGGHPTAAGGNLQLNSFDEYLQLWGDEETAYRDVFKTAIQTVTRNNA